MSNFILKVILIQFPFFFTVQVLAQHELDRTGSPLSSPPEITFLKDGQGIFQDGETIITYDSSYEITARVSKINEKEDIVEVLVNDTKIDSYQFENKDDYYLINANVNLNLGENIVVIKADRINSSDISIRKIVIEYKEKETGGPDSGGDPPKPKKILINNWDTLMPYKDKIYEDPEDRGVIQKRIIEDGAIEGKKSIEISWERIRRIRYGGWFIDLGHFNARHAKYLVFQIRLTRGDEHFWINIKDNENNQVGFDSRDALNITQTSTQKIKIPMSSFGPNINRSDLRDINFSFDRNISENNGAIIIDDFWFEF